MEEFQIFMMDSNTQSCDHQSFLNNNYEFSSDDIFGENVQDIQEELEKREKELFLCSQLGLFLMQEIDDLIEQQKDLVNDHTRVLLDLQSYEKSKNVFLDIGDSMTDLNETLSSMSCGFMSPESESSSEYRLVKQAHHAKKNGMEHLDNLEHLQSQIDEVKGELKRCGSIDSLTDVQSIPESTLTTFSSVTKNLQTDLDRLQRSHDLITRLELQLDSSRAKHRKLFNEHSSKLKELSQSLGSCVEKARPYFNAVRRARKIQIETQQAAMQYKRAVNLQKAGRDMVRVAEDRLSSAADKFDITWQEMLNQATLKVNEASREKDRIHSIHMRAAKNFKRAEEEKNELQITLQRSIVKAKPYFELQQDFQNKLEVTTKTLNALEMKLLEARQCYSAALSSIRRSGDGEGSSLALDSLAERGIGVGAENPFGDNSVLHKPMQDILRSEANTKSEENALPTTADPVTKRPQFQYNPYDLMYLKDTDSETASNTCSHADEYIQDF